MSVISYRQRITQTSGQITYDDQGEGTLLYFNSASNITDPVEVVFNPDPMEGQFIGLTTRRPISDLTLTSQYYPINGIVTSLSPDNPLLWYYSSEEGRWVLHP